MISSSVLRHLCRSVATSVRTHWGLSHVNRFTVREHNCGDITEKMIGKRVTVYGWIKSRRKEGKKIGFIVLSDAYGSVQLLSVNRNWEVPNRGSVVMATGLVQKRPEKDVNPKMTSGSVEILLDDIKLLGSNENISSLEWSDDEPLRMRNRYVDLRTEEMQRNLRLKSLLLTSVRNFLVQEGFVEIETPVLQKITPGGAHEFVVPTQIEDHYYCLGQSPQLYKQLLMVGGCDRYFQIAKCFRNETARADRQPEFQQIDVELSFTTRDGILDLIENLIVSVWPAFLDKVSIPFPRIQYKEAMTLYGSDKPDLRSKIELKTIEIQSEKQTNLSLITLVIPNGANEKHAANLKELGSKAATKVYYKGNLIGSCSNDDSCSFETEPSLMLSSQVKDHLRQSLHLNQSDYLFIAHGDDKLQRKVMGTLRNMCVNYMVESKMIQSEFGTHNFLWVIDFPMFLINETTGEIECGHHPFSAPKPEHLDKVYSAPLEVESDQFDLVLNGEEIGGGSMRITCPKLQKYVFENILKADPHSMEFFIRALSSGCPPHGGLAIGVDRLLKIISKADSIRDFIAFPKSMNCRDHLSSAPNLLTDELKSTYHLK